MDIGCSSLRLYGMDSTSEFHVKFRLRFVMGQLSYVGFPLNRIIVSISNTKSVRIGVIAEYLVATYDEVYTDQFVEDISDRFSQDFGVTIANVIPMPIRDGARFEHQQFVTALYLSYTNRVNRHDNNVVVAIPDLIPIHHAVAVPNPLPVPPPDPVPDLHVVALPNPIPVRPDPVPVHHAVAVPNTLPVPPPDLVLDLHAISLPNPIPIRPDPVHDQH